MDIVDRIKARIIVTEPTGTEGWRAEGCWEWQGSLDGQGYGQITYRLRQRSPCRCHRLMFELSTGQRLDSPRCVLHRCDNPKCCNPAHLFEGTKQDNTDDMHAKGRNRQPRGEKNGNAKLTGRIRAIRQEYATGQYSTRELGKRHGVSHTAIIRAVNITTWAHVV